MLAFLSFILLSRGEDPFKRTEYELTEHVVDDLSPLLETLEYQPIPRRN